MFILVNWIGCVSFPIFGDVVLSFDDFAYETSLGVYLCCMRVMKHVHDFYKHAYASQVIRDCRVSSIDHFHEQKAQICMITEFRRLFSRDQTSVSRKPDVCFGAKMHCFYSDLIQTSVSKIPDVCFL